MWLESSVQRRAVDLDIKEVTGSLIVQVLSGH